MSVNSKLISLLVGCLSLMLCPALSQSVPATTARQAFPQQRLDSLQKTDQLEDWLNLWYDYLQGNAGNNLSRLDQPFDALWRAPKSAPEEVALFYLQILAGYHQLQSGNILASTDRYEQAYRLVQQTTAITGPEILDYLIKPLGNNYTRLGDYQRAFFIQKEGLRIAEELQDAMQQASALANLSTTARWNDLPDQALAYARKGLQRVRTGTALQGLLLSTEADILQTTGQTQVAGQVTDQALRLFNRLPLGKDPSIPFWHAASLSTAAAIARKQEQFSRAAQLLHEALALYQRHAPTSRHREKMKLMVALGEVYTEAQQFPKAVEYFDRALRGLTPNVKDKTPQQLLWPATSSLYAENTLLDALTGKARVLHLLGQDSSALKGYQRAAVVIQKLRTAIFSVEAKRQLQRQSLQTTQEAVDLAYRLYQETGQQKYAEAALQFIEEQKARLLLDDLQNFREDREAHNSDSLIIRQNRLRQAIAYYQHAYVEALQQEGSSAQQQWQQKIAEAEYSLSLLDKQMQNRYPGAGWDGPVDAQSMFRFLPAGTVAWEYFTGPDRWYGLAVSHEGILTFNRIAKDSSLAASVADFVDRWFARGPDPMTNQPREYFHEAHQLYRQLKLSTLKGDAHLIILPDGLLGRLPFEALLTDSVYLANPARWPYMLWQAKTSYAYSLAVWAHGEQEPGRRHKKAFSGFFISPQAGSGLSVLKGVEQEVQSIRQILKGDYYRQRTATASALFQALRRSEVIHLSTHGFLIGERQLPAIQMADGQLLLSDLYPLQAHPSLVVISACQTATGLLSPGEGIISLARAFTEMGAGGVVSGLWDINDQTAAAITTLFYQNLLESQDKAGALYQAKRQWLAQDPTNISVKLPYYWAGLLYYGNHQPLTTPLQAAPLWPLWTWTLILPGILILLIVFYRRLRHR